MKEGILKVRHGNLKTAAKGIAGNYIEKSDTKRILDLIRHIGKRVKVDKSDAGSSKGGVYTFERELTPAEKKKREEIAKAIERDNPDMPMDKKMAIATAQAKKESAQMKSLKQIREASVQDIKDILTTIGSSKNMDQAVQMVMKKYKVPQGQAKAMVKKAIDSGVTYDKIKKKYAKESVELDEATRVSRKDFDKLKKGSMITIDYGSSIKGSTKRTFMVKSKTRSAKYNVDKVNMVDPNKPGGMKFHLYSRDGEDATLALGDMGATINSYSIKEAIDQVNQDFPNTLESLDERNAGKSATGYDIYHDTYSAAMQHAYAHAKKKHGVTVRPSEIDDKVAMGPKKPSSGKTVSHILKTDKKQNLHVQVYNTGRKYELNMYVESVEEKLSTFKSDRPITMNRNGKKVTVSKKDGQWHLDVDGKTSVHKSEKDAMRHFAKMEGFVEATILRTKTTRKQTAASKEKDKEKAVKAFKDVRKGKYPGVKFAETQDEACWDGYKQVGMKKKGDKMVPDCVPESVQEAADGNVEMQLQDIVNSKSAKTVRFRDGTVKVDMTTASMILQVLDKLNDTNREKLVNMMNQGKAGFMKAHSVVMKVIQKR